MAERPKLKPSIRIGIDLGGTKTEIIALDDSGQVLHRRRVPTPVGDYRSTLATIARLIDEAEKSLGICASVGIGMPGALSLDSGCVKNANSTVLNGKPFKEDLQALLKRAIRLENDANCFALSEAQDGAGHGSASVFGVILGTGVGAGWVINGKLILGAAHIAGEWGHNPLPSIAQLGLHSARERQLSALEAPGPACYCGRWGCVETWLSGPGFVADYARDEYAAEAGDAPNIDTPAVDALALDAQQLITRMRGGELRAVAAFDRYVDRLARALATVINIADPDVIILGGGMSRIPELADRVSSALAAYVFSDEIGTKILSNQHGDSSGVRGAAWLWNQS
jgi:fructokinase